MTLPSGHAYPRWDAGARTQNGRVVASGGMDPTGAAAIVTGGASGLGEATSRRLAAAGCHVVVVDLQDDKGKALAEELGGSFSHADVRNVEEVQAAVDVATGAGPLRVLVNCAGIGWAQRTIGRSGEPHDLNAFEQVVGVNLIGTFNVIRLAASAMNGTDPLDDGERGVIVSIASVAAFDGQIGQASYSASKGGIVGMTLPIARDLAAAGIRVNTIAPGIIDTPLFALAGDETKDQLGSQVLFPKRMGKPDEVAALVMQMVENSYVNGETVRLDGGIRMPPK